LGGADSTTGEFLDKEVGRGNRSKVHYLLEEVSHKHIYGHMSPTKKCSHRWKTLSQIEKVHPSLGVSIEEKQRFVKGTYGGFPK
jgi:hypothetical protein